MPEGREAGYNQEAEIQKKLAMYRRDLADHAEGMKDMDQQAVIETEQEIKMLEQELADLKKMN